MDKEMDDDIYTTPSRGPQMSVRKHHAGTRQMSRCSQFATVGLGAMGILLLTVITGLSVYYTFKIIQERDQLLGNCNAFTEEREMLAKNYSALTQERETCWSSLSALTKERDQLLHDNSILTQERDQLLKKLPCPEGWTSHSKCYYSISSRQSWAEARKACQAMGADMVTIEGKEEQVFVSQLKTHGWIGLQRHGSSWKWVDSTPFSTRYWRPGQPNGDNENCAMILPFPEDPILNWHDYPCSNSYSVICEKTANQHTV